MDIDSARAEFGAAVPGYLDTASMGLPTAGTVRAMSSAVRAWYEGTGRYADWEASIDRSRERWAAMAGVDAVGVGTIGSITTAVASVAHALSARPGLLVAHRAEFRSLLLPAIERFGEHRVRWITGPYTAQAFENVLDGDCAAVVISSVSSADGARVDLGRVAAAADGAGTGMIVDATQSEGIVSRGINYSRCAAVVTAGYKGLLAPRGTGFVVCSAETAPALPIAPSPYGMADADIRGSYGPSTGPLAGGAGLTQSPAWLSWVGMEPALEFLDRFSLKEREAWVLRLASRLRHGLESAGLRTQSSDLPSSVLSVAVAEPVEVLDALQKAGIRSAVRNGRLRLALHFYSDDSDIDSALNAITGLDREFFERTY